MIVLYLKLKQTEYFYYSNLQGKLFLSLHYICLTALVATF